MKGKIEHTSKEIYDLIDDFTKLKVDHYKAQEENMK